MAAIAFLGRRQLKWTAQTMVLSLVALAAALLYKNAFARADLSHWQVFSTALPLLLAVWYIAWRSGPALYALALYALLFASLLYSAGQLATSAEFPLEWAQSTPLGYFKDAIRLPWRESVADLQDRLSARYPQLALPADMRERIAQASVDVMPWESSLAVRNGLNYRPRPVPQSYSAYTPWLDDLNARRLDSPAAADYLLWVAGTPNAIDGRAAAWDESSTKRVLLENYVYAGQCKLPLRLWPYDDDPPLFLLKRASHVRRLVPTATKDVALAMRQELVIPANEDLVFLTLRVDRTIFGRLKAAALPPAAFTATFHYADGTIGVYRAVLPILETGVLVNRRVESAEEMRNFLIASPAKNTAVTSISFSSSGPWEFQTPFRGRLASYRLIENRQ